MTSDDIHIIQLTLDQKDLFEEWLVETEKKLAARLASIKSLRSQLTSKNIQSSESSKIQSKSNNQLIRSQSWTSALIDAMKQLDGAQTSTQIVSWFMENDAALNEKGKRYITKNVTSKLALLVEKGRIEKNTMGGKNFYALKD